MGGWEADGGDRGKSTIQCKFTAKSGATLSLSQLKAELPKAARLAKRGLASDYIIITNAGISGEAEAQICEAFEAAGVGRCRVFDGGWIQTQLRERPNLRMLAPRVYGVGDLTQILSDSAYRQARYMLSSLGQDLGCFVPTQAHRQAVAALNARGFVILLGEPACGKSTIAATLALGALDQGCSGALRISRPEQLDRWLPEDQQVLWVDDAFGANQLDARRVQDWNMELPRLAAAVRSGSKVIFTSRSYIWSAARDLLKVDAFRPLADSQVVIKVEGLMATERAQILYNHVRKGEQPKLMVSSLKPFLPEIAANPKFLPEIARRLGDPNFTRGLKINAESLTQFVEKPVEFLEGVLRLLDAPSQAAIALIYLSRHSAVLSPLPDDEHLALVCRLQDVTPAAVARAMEHLNGSLTLLVEHPDGPRWTFRHPTIGDAFSALVGQSPERVALYVRGADLERIVSEAQCDSLERSSVHVRIPPSLYATLIERIGDAHLHIGYRDFLAERCDQAFLAMFAKARPDVFKMADDINIGMAYSPTTNVVHALHWAGILPDGALRIARDTIRYIAMNFFDTGFLVDGRIREILGEDEFQSLERDFQNTWLWDVNHNLRRWREDAKGTDDIHYHLEQYEENINRAQGYYRYRSEFEEAFAWLYAQLALWREEIGEDLREEWQTPSAPLTASIEVRTIFADIDA